jgi:hypothetical protein
VKRLLKSIRRQSIYKYVTSTETMNAVFKIHTEESCEICRVTVISIENRDKDALQKDLKEFLLLSPE